MTNKGCANTMTMGCIWIVLFPIFAIISMALFDSMFLAPLVFMGFLFVMSAIGAIVDKLKNGKSKET